MLVMCADGLSAAADEKNILPVPPQKYILKEGKVFKIESGSVLLEIDGEILGITNQNDNLYYIKKSGEDWIAGIYTDAEKKVKEIVIGAGFSRFYKLEVYGEVFYFLADMVEGNGYSASENGRVLVRLSPENNERKILKDVLDFRIMAGKLLLLIPSGVDYNGVIIPVTLTGDRYLERVIDNRLLFVTNGVDVEVIDIISERNVYLYRDGKIYPYSTDYNIVLEFNDPIPVSGTDSDNMIYYQISLNGLDAGRTETTPMGVPRTTNLKAETGKYCIVKAERWELDKTRGRYIRVNNIYQPGEIRMFIPEKRIMKIRFDFDGIKYTMTQSVYEN